MRYFIATLIAIAALTGCSTPNTPAAPTAPVKISTPTVTAPPATAKTTKTAVPPCPSEDYEGPQTCLWDASTQGNGKGRSFIWDGTKVIYTSNAKG